MNATLLPANQFVADKDALRNHIEAQNRAIGLIRDPDATAEQSRALIRAEGVRTEDCIFSCGILSARDEE